MLRRDLFVCRRLEPICFLLVSLISYAVCKCLVNPKNVIAAAGETVSLSCSASPGDSISYWQMHADLSKRIVVYTAPVYRSDGSIRTNRSVANGYSVDNPMDNEAILRVHAISLSQAAKYYCICSDNELSVDSSEVAVIESNFTTNSSVCGGYPVTVVCSISSSENISYELRIKDDFENTVTRQNGSSSCNDPMSCKLSYTITENSSAEQSFKCTVNATTTNKYVRFSKLLNASINFADSNSCSGNNEPHKSTDEWDGSQTLRLVALCVIPIALFAIPIILAIKYRQQIRRMICQQSDVITYASKGKKMDGSNNEHLKTHEQNHHGNQIHAPGKKMDGSIDEHLKTYEQNHHGNQIHAPVVAFKYC